MRLKKFGTTLEEVSQKFFPKGVYKKKKPAVLKLGGEVEYYRPTVIWGFSVLDSLHAARRAQALDSNMKKSNLKYLTKYLKMNKENRVYVPGDVISAVFPDRLIMVHVSLLYESIRSSSSNSICVWLVCMEAVLFVFTAILSEVLVLLLDILDLPHPVIQIIPILHTNNIDSSFLYLFIMNLPFIYYMNV